MTADTLSPLVPKLRFAEFRDTGDWMTKILDNQGRFLSSLTGKTAKDFDVGDAAFIPYMNVFSNTFTNIFDLRSVNVGGGESQNAVAKGDVFFTISSEIPEEAGMSSVLLEEIANCYLNSFCALFRFDNGKSPNPVFLGYYLRSALARAHLSRGAQGATRYNIPKTIFRSLPLQLPSGPEQQKIADCLGSLDDLIAAEDQKLETLRQHKQGLMQHLLPQAGETKPRLRFPEFRNAPEWEEKELGDVSEVRMCKRIFASQTNPNGGVPFYKIGTLGGEPDAFISKDLFEEYRSKYNFPRSGEILITCSGTVGKCLTYDSSEAYFQDSNIVWIDNPTLEVSNEFLLVILSNVNWSTLNSTTITRIYGSDLRGLAIKFPQNEQEQIRIADCLTAIDDQLDAQARKLDILNQHKRGLLQQIFPSLEQGSL